MSTARSPWKVGLFCLVMLALAVGSNAVMDALATRYDRSVFAQMPEHRQWLDPRVSWKNKWRDGEPKKGDAFPLSSTVLAGTTDSWHAAKALVILFLSLALIAPWTLVLRWPWWGWVLAVLGVFFVYGVIFEGLYAGLLLQ